MVAGIAGAFANIGSLLLIRCAYRMKSSAKATRTLTQQQFFPKTLYRADAAGNWLSGDSHSSVSAPHGLGDDS